MGPGAPSGHRTGGGGRAGSAPHGGAGAVRSGRWGARAARSGRGRLAALCRKAPAFPANFYWDAEAARAASLGYRWRRLRVPVRAARAGRSGAASGGPSGPTRSRPAQRNGSDETQCGTLRCPIHAKHRFVQRPAQGEKRSVSSMRQSQSSKPRCPTAALHFTLMAGIATPTKKERQGRRSQSANR